MPTYSDLNSGTGRIFLYDPSGDNFISSAPNSDQNRAFLQCFAWLVVQYPGSSVWLNADYSAPVDYTNTNKGATAIDITTNVMSDISAQLHPLP